MAVALTYAVSYNTSKQPSTRVRTSQFGDGYRQHTIDGTNYDDEIWSVNFKPLDTADANALETILLNSLNGTVNYLSWVPPGESTTKYYTATNITKMSIGPSKWALSCQLTREFPLV